MSEIHQIRPTMNIPTVKREHQDRIEKKPTKDKKRSNEENEKEPGPEIGKVNEYI